MKILGSIGRPSLEVVYNIDEIVVEEGKSKLQHSVEREHYYVVNYGNIKPDMTFSGDQEKIKQMLASGQLVKLNVSEGNGKDSNLEFKKTTDDASTQFWGHAASPPYPRATKYDLSKKDAMTSDFDARIANIKKGKEDSDCGGGKEKRDEGEPK